MQALKLGGMVMKLVIVSEFFYPYRTGTQRILTELAEDLVEYGLNIDVLTTKNSYREERKKVLKREEYKGINIKRIFSTNRDRNKKIGRILNYITFVISVFFNLLIKRDYDKILLVSNPPLVPYIGYLMKKIRGKNFIYLVHDVYPDVAEKLGVIKKDSIISKAMNYVNNKVYKNAEKVIVLGQDMKKVIESKGTPSNRIEIITNWSDSKVIYEKEVEPGFSKAYEMMDKLNVLYTGNISEVHDIETIVDVARKLKDDENIKFTFVGDGKKKPYILEVIKNEGLNNVQVLDYVFGEEYNSLLNCANAFIVSLGKGIEGLGVPSKTYSYMAAGKPIIAIMTRSCEIGNMVYEENLGIQVESGNSKDIVSFIYDIKKNMCLYEEISNNVRRVFKDKYERWIVTKKFYNAIMNDYKDI